MRTYSSDFRTILHATGAGEAPLYLLEISHDNLTEPVRVVLDNDDFPYGAAHVFRGEQAYAEGDIVVPYNYNGRFYEVDAAGDSGVSEPIWPSEIDETVVSGDVTFRCAGVQYKSLYFRITLPDDRPRQLPRARLSLDNVGAELVSWLELSGGGQGAQCRIMQMLRSDPGTIEWEITMDLTNLAMDAVEITGILGFDDILNRPAVPFTYRPDTAPGLF